MHYSCLTSASIFVFAPGTFQTAAPRTKLEGTGVGAERWGAEKVSLPHYILSWAHTSGQQKELAGEEAPSWEGQVHAHLWLHILCIQFCSQCSAPTLMPTTASWSKTRPEVNTRADSASCFADLLPSAWRKSAHPSEQPCASTSSRIFIKSPTTPHWWTCSGSQGLQKIKSWCDALPEQTDKHLSALPLLLHIYNQKL